MMNGIDVSKWQKGLDLFKIKTDFVIVKATEGKSYVDPCFSDFMKQIKALNKPFGFYHFSRPDVNANPLDEAHHFYEVCKDLFHDGIPCLDWESKAKSNVAWAKAWLDEIQRITGVKPVIYMSQSVCKTYDFSAIANADYGLWIAKYRDYVADKNFDMSNAGSKPTYKWWKFYCMWQWTSSGRLDGYDGNLDCDLFMGDLKAWNAYAGKKEPKTHTVVQGETLSSIAMEYNTTVDEIVAKNSLIKVGQILKV